MELLICGSGAAESMPALFCDCQVCQTARQRGGKELRSRTAYQLGDQLRIDWGPDSAWHGQRFNLHYERLSHLLMTHAHNDHWLVNELDNRRRSMIHNAECSILTIHGNEAIGASLHEKLHGDLNDYGIRFHQVQPFEPFRLDDLDMTVVAVAANHDPDQLCLNYVIGHAGRWLFQGNDTGFPSERTWHFLKDYRFNIAILDATFGTNPAFSHNDQHMSAQGVIDAFAKLEAQGSLADDCRRITTHFSHQGLCNHDQLEAIFAPHGIDAAYDGLRVPLLTDAR